MSDIIRVQSLSKQFRNLTAVDDLSFTVREGDVYGFLGQNGAGKSTTIRMLLTLVAPTAGSIEIFGYNLPGHRNEILRQVGAVVEKPDLYKYLSAYDNLKLFAKLSGIKYTNQLLMQQLEMVGLAERANDTRVQDLLLESLIFALYVKNKVKLCISDCLNLGCWLHIHTHLINKKHIFYVY